MASGNPSWERRPSIGGAQTLPPITAISNPNGSSPPGDPRDSGNWSLASNSQRASNISEVSQPALTLPPIESHSTRNSPGETGHSTYSQTQSPISTNFGASTTSLHASSGANYQPPPHGQDAILPTPSPSASRRSSFDARLGNLQLSSPVAGNTPAASQVSLSSTLHNPNRDSLASQIQRERGIHSNSPHPMQNHENVGPGPGLFASTRPNETGIYAPTSRGPVPARTAPPIAPTKHFGQASHPNALNPTPGLPWAFPDPDVAIDDKMHPRTSTTSLPGSAASSIYSGHSGVVPHPPHMATMLDVNGHARGSLPSIGQDTHHHVLGPRRSSVIGHEQQATPYSRTPELRVSHKLAERKRRKEMKELFDELRDVLPAERGGKSSKWEVLTKAIEHVNSQKNTIKDQKEEMERMKKQLHDVQEDLNVTRNELQHFRALQAHGNYSGHGPPGPDGGYHPHGHHANGSGKMQGLEPC